MLNKLNSYKWVLIITLFLIGITGFRLVWNDYLTNFDYEQKPFAENGVLDLRDLNFNDTQTLQLNGEWEFYPYELLTSNEQQINSQTLNLNVPNKWTSGLENSASFSYGTYRLRILIDEHHPGEFGLRFNKLNQASAIYVNGQNVGNSGQVAAIEKQHDGSSVPYTVSFTTEQNEIDLFIQVSGNHINGGIVKPIQFGTSHAIDSLTRLSNGLQLLLFTILAMHFIYALILYFIRSAKNKGLLYYFLLLAFALVTVITSDDKLLYNWFSFSYNWEIKIVYLAYIGVGVFLPLVIDQLFQAYVNKQALRYFIIYCLFYVLFVLFAPPLYIILSSRVLLLAVLLLSVWISSIGLIKAKIAKNESIFLLLSSLSVGVNVLWATFNNNALIKTMHYPVDLIIALLCFTGFWFKRFFRMTSEVELLANKLQTENKRKDEFLVNTSHELRNPLHGITNIIQSLLDDQTHPLHKEHTKRLSILVNVSNRMSAMLDDLLDVTRLKEKTIQLHIQKVHLQSVVTGVLDMIELMIDGKPIRLKIDIKPDFPFVMADESRLIQILFNLIHNAVKFTDKGTITIRATIEHDEALISIEDTGIGIKDDELEQIFQPYEQAFDQHKRASGGFGIGLSICKQLIEQHQSNLHVQSTLGKGSTFSFTLPVYTGNEQIQEHIVPVLTSESKSEQPIKTEKVTNNTINILAVDDDPVNLTIIKNILVGEGYAMTGVTSASQAMKLLKAQSFDLVISDVMMPQVSGYELTRNIRELFLISELPVLLLTARTRTEDILTGFNSGANDYVTKPVNSWELKSRVHALTKLKVSIEERIRIEGAWLQSQIQPHFIFNTLNSIAALGEFDIEKMQELLDAFSNYLRFSFDFYNADPIVPLKHELAFVRSYLYIEQTRFGERLSIEWDIDENTNFSLPPLTIQPLVENAVKHGIQKSLDGGNIRIKIKRLVDDIEISIIDDGIGMTEQEISEAFSDSESTVRTGVGLRNVDRRLKQLYGEGLKIQSTPTQKTTVSFRVPK